MRRWVVVGVVALMVLAAGLAEAAPGREDGTFFIRLSYGWGDHADSEHARLLSEDGYNLDGRNWLGADFAVAITSRWFAGAWWRQGWASEDARHAAPTLEEETVMGGLQVPYVSSGKNIRLVVSPRAGVAATKFALYDDGDWAGGPAFGFDAGFVLVHLPIGVSFGYTYAPTEAPTELGRPYQAGGWHLLLSGVMDDF